MDKKDILKAFHFRHACKEFDKGKKISKEDLIYILETGRLSPSSFGLEQWKFLSCPIGGFLPDKVGEILGVDADKFQVGLMVPFGYRLNSQPPKTRLPFDEVVEFL